MIKVGVGLDGRIGLTLDELRELAREARRLGYASVWTPYATHDPFVLCAEWWRASGLATGVSVVPLSTIGAPVALAKSAATLAELTGGRFVLGIGSGQLRKVAAVRERLRDVRGLLARSGDAPVYLAALGPRMLHLAGELADGAALNWCSPEQIAWSRERIAEGAREAGRDPANVVVHEYIRVCVDADVDAARLAVARALLPYALRPAGGPSGGYRAHFDRMGFGAALDELEARRAGGAKSDELAQAFPPDLLRRVAAWGEPAKAREDFLRLAAGLDVAVVRVVPARPATEAVLATMLACRPG